MNRSLVAGLALTTALGLSACKDPASRVAHATTGAAVANPTLGAAPAAGTERLAFAPANSRVEFVASKVTRSHNGSFQQFTGTIDFSPSRMEASRVHLDIDTGSVTTDTPQLTTHLRSGDFFDVARFPHATFDSVEIRPGGERGATHTITGNLALHGQTHSITFPATVNATPTEVTATSEFSIDRRDFAIVYPGMANDLIRDNVIIRLNIRAPRSAAQ